MVELVTQAIQYSSHTGCLSNHVACYRIVMLIEFRRPFDNFVSLKIHPCSLKIHPWINDAFLYHLNAAWITVACHAMSLHFLHITYMPPTWHLRIAYMPPTCHLRITYMPPKVTCMSLACRLHATCMSPTYSTYNCQLLVTFWLHIVCISPYCYHTVSACHLTTCHLHASVVLSAFYLRVTCS